MTVRKSLAQQEEYRVRDTEREPQTEAGRALYGFEPSAGMLRHVLAIEAEAALLARRAPGDRGEPLDVERLAHAMYADGCIRPPLTDHAKHVLVALRALRADSRPEQPR